MKMLLKTVSFAALLAASAAASAADETAVDEEEIVVTAQKREQSLKDVPASIAVVREDQIHENHIRDFADVAALTPGFVSAPNYIGIRNSAIRGIANNAFGFSEDPSIGLFVNGVYQGRSGSQSSVFYDVARVEVVKGPQATLFGRSSIAGAISVITHKPVDVFEASARLGIGERNRLAFEGMVNTPVGEGVALRLAYYGEHEDGYVTNLAGGAKLAPTDIQAGRASLRFERGAFDNILTLEAEHRRQSGVTYSAVGLPDFTVNTSLLGEDARSQSDSWNLTNQLTYAASDKLSLVSLTSFRHVQNVYGEDFDALPQIIMGPYLQGHKDDIYAQDFRMVYEADSGLVVVAGLSGFYEERSAWVQNYVSLLAFSPPLGLPNPSGVPPLDYALAMAERANFTGRNAGWSAYVDVTVPLSETFKIIGGVRYNYDRKQFAMSLPNPATMPENAHLPFAGSYYLWGFWTSAPIEGETSWDDLSFRLAATWEVSPETTLYASWNQGWKAGGFDSFTVNAPPGFPYFAGLDAYAAGAELRPFAPETADSFEIGVKGTALERRLRYALTGYHFIYRDLQKSINQGGRPALTNVGEATAWGVEGDFAFAIDANFSLTGSFAYNDTEVTEDPVSPAQVGQPLNRAPKWQAALGLDYRAPAPWAGDGEVFAGVLYTFRDKFRTDDILVPLVEASNLVNLRVGYAWPDDRYVLTLYADNVFDEFTYNRYSRRTPFGAQQDARSVFGKPRTIGLDLAVRF